MCSAVYSRAPTTMSIFRSQHKSLLKFNCIMPLWYYHCDHIIQSIAFIPIHSLCNILEITRLQPKKHTRNSKTAHPAHNWFVTMCYVLSKHYLNVTTCVMLYSIHIQRRNWLNKIHHFKTLILNSLSAILRLIIKSSSLHDTHPKQISRIVHNKFTCKSNRDKNINQAPKHSDEMIHHHQQR